MSQPTISIALCTCNGGRFLNAFLDSLSRQSVLPFEMVVCDDASDDDTLQIIAQFAKTVPFPVRVIDRPARLGHTANFLDTAGKCKGEWIAFADQDDVWFDNKLEEAASVIRAKPAILLVNQRALLCSEDLVVRDTRPFPYDRATGVQTRPHMPLPLVWPGFLMTVKASLLQTNAYPSNDFDNAKMGHGRWAFLLASTYGSYFITRDPSAYYRRHDHALTGDYRPQEPSAGDFRQRSLDDIQPRAVFAAHAAECLGILADKAADADARAQLDVTAANYRKAALAMRARISCYWGETWRSRIASIFSAARAGAYFGPTLYRGGVRALLKDAMAAISGGLT